jgi:beta-glucosidase
MAVRTFPDRFMWGTATAAFQVEGATTADGRGESIWDRFCATPGKIVTGETGDPACDSYYRVDEDVAVMRQLGVNAHRFSIAWPRVVPAGDGPVNRAGLDYYDRLVDALHAAGIVPFVTLYHWDLPQALQDRGGWAERGVVDAFVGYVDAVVERLGDRVMHWATFNEPWCIAIDGNYTGEHAPGVRDLRTALQVGHNVLVAHGRAVPMIRARHPEANVGIVLNFTPAYPATDSADDGHATIIENDHRNRWFVEPIMGRGYPLEGWEAYGEAVPEINDGDLETISVPVDFLGVNYYTRVVVRADTHKPGRRCLNKRDQNNVTGRDWEIFPQGLYELLTWLHRDYRLGNLVVTENGASYHDVVSASGEVHDEARQRYLHEHVAAVHCAIEDGVPVTGYYCWTLMDNFEWTFGTLSRFGLAYVDFATQRRIIKDSGRWYAQVAQSNALTDERSSISDGLKPSTC